MERERERETDGQKVRKTEIERIKQKREYLLLSIKKK